MFLMGHVWLGFSRCPVLLAIPMLRDVLACIDFMRLSLLMPDCRLPPADHVWLLLCQDALWLALFWIGTCGSLADALCVWTAGSPCGSTSVAQGPCAAHCDALWSFDAPVDALVPEGFYIDTVRFIRRPVNVLGGECNARTVLAEES
jgi:hypothetical protein